MFVTSSSDSFPASLSFFLLDQYKRSKRETQPQLQPSNLWYNCQVNRPTHQNIAKPDQLTSCFNDNSCSFVTAMENQDTCPDLLFSNDTVDDCSGRMTTTQHKSNNKLIKAHFVRHIRHICQKGLSAQHLTTKHQSPSHTNLDCSAKFTRVFHVFQKWCWKVLGFLLATSFSAVGKIYTNSPMTHILSIQSLDPVSPLL